MMKRLPFSRLISTVLLAVFLLGMTPARASAEQRIIVRTGGLLSGLTVVQSACKLLGCKVLYGLDGSLGKLFLVSVPDALDVSLVFKLLGGVLGVVGVEYDRTVWTEGGYAAKLGLQALHPAAQGTGMSTEEAQALRIPDPALFAEYMTKVWASTDEFLPTLTPAALERIVPMKFVGDMPLVRVLAFVGVTHGFTHFGEVELTRTLVGAAPVYGA